MLDGMWSAVKSDIETELISSSHLSALLLQQLLQQADEVHLRMKVNVAELENKLVKHVVKSLIYTHPLRNQSSL